jgi:sensor c-di-GMP phosphodiesterase-like protein
VAEIPVTELKLDRTFVAAWHDERMVGAIVRLGRTLGLRLVAEGVETNRDGPALRRRGWWRLAEARAELSKRPFRSAPGARRTASPLG